MKRLTCVLLVSTLLLFSVAGCSEKNSRSGSRKENRKEDTKEEEEVVELDQARLIKALEDNGYVEVDSYGKVISMATNGDNRSNAYSASDELNMAGPPFDKYSQDYDMVVAESVNYTTVYCFSFTSEDNAAEAYDIWVDYCVNGDQKLPDGCEYDSANFSYSLFNYGGYAYGVYLQGETLLVISGNTNSYNDYNACKEDGNKLCASLGIKSAFEANLING